MVVKRTFPANREDMDKISWYCAVLLVSLILMFLFSASGSGGDHQPARARRGTVSGSRPCDEIYVVEEGETLHTISDKCGDPYIVERNPHIHDPDDVFPGLAIRLSPFTDRERERRRISS